MAPWRRVASSIAAVLLLRVVPLGSQEPPPPAYPTQAAAITVDVVVLDEHGEPVRGLAKEDFTVLDDGRPQTIVGFEARGPATEAVPPAEARPAELAVATNVGPAARPGRVLALLVDDLGITSPVASQLKPALAGWIRDHALPTDELTITTTSGAIWWTDVVESGREDLLTVLRRIQGKRFAAESFEAMSEAEAYRIAVLEQGNELASGAAARSRPLDAVPGPGGGLKLVGSSTMERVTQRWLDSHVCPPCSSPNEPALDCRELRQCFQRVQLRARELHEASTARTAGVLRAIDRLSKALAAVPGRKSILVVSEDLLRDVSLDSPFREAIDTAQRSNTSIYFLAARGLIGPSFLGAEGASQPPRPQDIGQMGVEETTIATGGGESLADETGGTLTRSNDLAAGLERMASDSSSYYLLGYQPEKLPDGRWHELRVKVARPGVKVRARRGYRALRPEDLARSESRVTKEEKAKEQKDTTAGKRPLAPGILAGHAREGLPLRLAAYVMDTDHAGKARVQVVLEVDNGRVQVNRSLTPWTASLDLTLLAAGLFQPPFVPVDERLALTLGPSDVGNGWWLLPREVWLQPGVWQIRALVKDVATGVAGLVAQRVEVPDVDQPYVSSLLVTDRTMPPRRPGEPERLVPTARRVFDGKAPIYCEYEVFSFGGGSLPGVAQVWGGYVLERPDGQAVSEEPASLIAMEGSRAVRRIVLRVDKLEPGEYELAVTVQDRLAGRTIAARTSFQIAHDPAPGP